MFVQLCKYHLINSIVAQMCILRMIVLFHYIISALSHVLAL
uniref:Uncharacterized protein n=1 Tax=Arundo donax TaxID=35708 RepID=A0A0A9H3N9_ARUDO